MDIDKTSSDLVFEFAKYTEITDLAFACRPDFRNESYTRFFICSDVNDFWLIRMIPGYNTEYEEDESSILLERNSIPKASKKQNLTLSRVVKIIEDDSGDNWDFCSYDCEEDAIEAISGGYGINNLKPPTNIN